MKKITAETLKWQKKVKKGTNVTPLTLQLIRTTTTTTTTKNINTSNVHIEN